MSRAKAGAWAGLAEAHERWVRQRDELEKALLKAGLRQRVRPRVSYDAHGLLVADLGHGVSVRARDPETLLERVPAGLAEADEARRVREAARRARRERLAARGSR